MGTFLVQQKGDKTFILLDKVPHIYLFYGDFLPTIQQKYTKKSVTVTQSAHQPPHVAHIW